MEANIQTPPTPIPTHPLTNLSTSSTVVKAMTDTWKNQGVVTQVQVLEINATGAVCV